MTTTATATTVTTAGATAATTRARPSAGDRHDPRRRPVVVGVDCCSESEDAVRWAAREAVSRGVPLRIVYAWQPPLLDLLPIVEDRIAVGDLRQQARTLVARQATLVRGVDGLEVTTEVAQGAPAEVLTGAGTPLLVLGAHTHSTISRAVLGSVSSAVAATAHCAVVVVHPGAGRPAEVPGVVVGLHGDQHDQAVLGVAFEYAARHELPVKAVLCWHPPLADRVFAAPEHAERELAEAVAGWRGEYPQVRLEPLALRGDPVDVLVEASASRDLLVVGRTTSHRWLAALLGAVAGGVLHRASCPVMVVPAA